MKIYTRRGDGGETDLFGSGRVPKDDGRVAAYGEVDELNSVLGVCRAATSHADLDRMLEAIPRELFALGAYLATPERRHRETSGMPEPRAEEIAALEARIDEFEKELAPLQRFVLPGGCAAAAHFHVARTVCRRAERALVALDRSDPLEAHTIGYLNRLSDLLFVCARLENARAGVPDVEWEGRGG